MAVSAWLPRGFHGGLLRLLVPRCPRTVGRLSRHVILDDGLPACPIPPHSAQLNSSHIQPPRRAYRQDEQLETHRALEARRPFGTTQSPSFSFQFGSQTFQVFGQGDLFCFFGSIRWQMAILDVTGCCAASAGS